MANNNSTEEKPLTLPSPVISGDVLIDEEAHPGRWSSQYLRQRRLLLCCSGCCGAAIIILGLIILILAFTVFKIKDPELSFHDIYLEGASGGAGAGAGTPVSLNFTLTADVSIKNPNEVSFKFGDSTTEMYYGGETVGVAHVPRGVIKAERTLRMNVTIQLLADRIARTNLTSVVIGGGDVNVTSFTDIEGRVSVLGIYKRDIEVTLNCSVALDVQQQEVRDKVCVADVR